MTTPSVISSPQPTRRTVATGAAWAIPTVTLASQAPAAAASTGTVTCPACLQAGLGGAFTAQAVTVLGLSNATGTALFNLDSSSCPIGIFQPAYTFLGLGGSISWSDGQVTPIASGQTGAGTLGQISAFISIFTTFGVTMPDDLFPPYVKTPTSFCFDFTAIFIPIIPIPQIECSYRICYDVTGVLSIGTVGLGTGTVNWTGVLSNGTLTPL